MQTLDTVIFAEVSGSWSPLLGKCPSLGQGSGGRVTPWIAHGLSPRSSGSPFLELPRALPDAPRLFHLVELRPNTEGLSSLSQLPAATPQTRLEGLARLTSHGFTTLGARKH